MENEMTQWCCSQHDFGMQMQDRRETIRSAGEACDVALSSAQRVRPPSYCSCVVTA